MPTWRILKNLKDQIYFVTFSVNHLYYIFDRHNRFEILEESFVYCQKYKGLKIYGFVFMLNHLHFVGQAPDLIAVVRDMKKYLTNALQKNIIAAEPGIFKLFEENGKFKLWYDKNYPKLIESEEMYNQKMEYIQLNPVRKKYVYYPEDWEWSSVCKIPTKIKISYL
ncbi:hypothetical protein GW853_01355 [Candidatus Kuenenbacteria bacterium]|uniref:Transposase IS200-like domain-containing protein n=4 Tax=Candidatus Kueneniibacteriota TaxID=1752740 RepID=A0A1J5FMK7_9BACT|nr:hypothetical protein [Candidatus Kuenenbacteria bacterium]OIP56248.1 MAG: hypothetical protein AUK13_01405 [Candidatus Kuenenbacteria bacterium CG2_30_39_24]